MKFTNIFKRTYYAILFHKRTNKLLFEHNETVDFDIYKSDWKTWYADPTVFKYEGKEWLFVEKMDMMKRKGSIAVAQINEEGIGLFREVLNEDFHLSYPIVFKKDNNVYMIPESAKEKAVYLYKCTEFPYRWEKQRALLKDNYYADTNVLFYNNHWYLITGEMDPLVGSRTRLHIYNADLMEEGTLKELFTEQRFKYSYISRGAGNILYIDNKIIRPTQVGDSQHYGKGINFCNVIFGNRYSERVINKFDCDRVKLSGNVKLTGTHTYGLSDNFEIIDIQFSVIAHPIIVISTLIRKIKSYL